MCVRTEFRGKRWNETIRSSPEGAAFISPGSNSGVPVGQSKESRGTVLVPTHTLKPRHFCRSYGTTEVVPFPIILEPLRTVAAPAPSAIQIPRASHS